MTTQALYNKWRAQNFGQILGQEHITRTLQSQIRAGRIGHAYLFTGIRGTGKTSMARIMAKAVNCVGETEDPPCNQCHICQSITDGRSLDLIEIDAASNRGIDEIRDLRDRVNFSPHECRHKVYVIDEVHMLTNEAFNALLKTLEEPPSHVIFILCTTQPHRLPDTILSRCQRFDFRRGSVSSVTQKLQYICEQEDIDIASDALDLIARRAGGSFRDAESLLDQLASYSSTEITVDLIRSILGSVSSALICRLVQSLVAGDVPAGLRAINQAIDQGAEPRQFLGEILEHLRALLILRVGAEDNLDRLSPDSLAQMRRLVREDALSLGILVGSIRLFNEAGQGLRYAVRPQLPLELAFIEAALEAGAGPAQVARPQEEQGEVTTGGETPDQGNGQQAPVSAESSSVSVNGEHKVAIESSAQTSSDDDTSSATLGVKITPTADEGEAVEPLPGIEQVAQPVSEPGIDYGKGAGPSQELTLERAQGSWNLVLPKMKLMSHQVRALLNSAYPIAVQDKTITLGCEAAFHRDKLSEEKKLGLVEKVLSEVLGAPCYVKCVVAPRPRGTLRHGQQRPRPSAGQSQTKGSRESLRQELLNHPVVKELERRGGRVSRVSLYDEEQ